MKKENEELKAINEKLKKSDDNNIINEFLLEETFKEVEDMQTILIQDSDVKNMHDQEILFINVANDLFFEQMYDQDNDNIGPYLFPEAFERTDVQQYLM